MFNQLDYLLGPCRKTLGSDFKYSSKQSLIQDGALAEEICDGSKVIKDIKKCQNGLWINHGSGKCTTRAK